MENEMNKFEPRDIIVLSSNNDDGKTKCHCYGVRRSPLNIATLSAKENDFLVQLKQRTTSSSTLVSDNIKTKRWANETKINAHGAIAAAKCASSSSAKTTLSCVVDAKQKRLFRKAGGKIWYDPTMEQWPIDDFRLFVGNLGREVSDHMLCTAFMQYSSFIKAHVVKNRETRMTRGCYGFVSFRSSADYLRAIKELNGTYIGSRPMKIKKSDWKKRSIIY